MAIGGIIGGHHRHSVVASRVAMFAHLLFLTTAVLMLVWLLRFRGGINIQSDDPEQIFNVHPFVMTWGFILLIGEAILVYTTIPMNHRAQKMVHMLVHLVAFILGVFGIYAAFKFHNVAVVPDLETQFMHDIGKLKIYDDFCMVMNGICVGRLEQKYKAHVAHSC
uniref:Cytochrome b561 n=1 Tax=Aegilops tauschii TaxID=37682 RepID=M8BZT9_AEGTA